ncbi:MAG TPA: hypothetical protein VNT79_13185 [Phycisphaerae bacterium]|nr:hypothetical protein [Phycisphaerae bacterium]
MLNSPVKRVAILALACLLAFAPDASAAIVVGHWTFDENGGTTAADSSGHNLHGTIQGPLAWTPGQFGSALHFDPAGADPPPEYVRIAHNPILNFTNSVSVSFWIKAAPQPCR